MQMHDNWNFFMVYWVSIKSRFPCDFVSAPCACRSWNSVRRMSSKGPLIGCDALYNMVSARNRTYQWSAGTLHKRNAVSRQEKTTLIMRASFAFYRSG